MYWKRFLIILPCLLLLFFQTFLLQGRFGVFGSPDETAVSRAVSLIVAQGSAAFSDPVVVAYPFVHPRSWVSQAGRVVPIGFLGLPFVLAALTKLGFSSDLMAGLLALSGMLPLFLLLRRWFGARSAYFGTLFVYSFPVVLLYTNRFYFSHLGQIVLLLWSAWLILKGNKYVYVFLAGLLSMAALAFRPSEWFWIIPLAWIFLHKYPLVSLKRWLVFGLGAVCFSVPFLWVQHATYGSFLTVGYLLHESLPVFVTGGQVELSLTRVEAEPLLVTVTRVLFPFGFHPRNVLYNVYHFWIIFLWPWAALSVALVVRALRFSTRPFRFRLPWVIVSVVFLLLLIVYGSGLYADHIRPREIAIGNSFLRYVMPVYFALGVLVAFVHARTIGLERRVYEVICLALMLLGIAFAMYRSDEGLVYLKRELVRYEEIREQAKKYFQPQDIVLSPRSDKVFFPSFRTISPIPVLTSLPGLVQKCQCSLGWFDRPLTADEVERFSELNFKVELLQAFGNESLYRLSLL